MNNNYSDNFESSLHAAHDLKLLKSSKNHSPALKKIVNVANEVLFLAQKYGSVNTRDLMYKLKVCENSARKYLKVLHDLGYLKKLKEGKELFYEITEDGTANA
jgi:predicted transcriptional regulator